jgi:membrane protein YdbS with pleckstrin-like domain
MHQQGADMNRLEPGQLWVMRIHALVFAATIGAAALVAEAALVPALALPRGAIAGVAVLLIFYLVLVAPGRHYRAWGYAIDERDLRLRHGIWVETMTLVPLERVQHIDVSQGPIERGFGVCRLIVHTAGTQFSRVVLPGLSRPDAERMRDSIRARISAEAE